MWSAYYDVLCDGLPAIEIGVCLNLHPSSSKLDQTLKSSTSNSASFLFQCAESSATVAMLVGFFSKNKVSIKSMFEYCDAGITLLRIEWSTHSGWTSQDEFFKAIAKLNLDTIEGAAYSVRLFEKEPSVGLLCSEHTHVLVDLLSRRRTEHYPAFNVPFVISDHERIGKIADQFGVPFFYIPHSLSATEIQRQQRQIIERYSPDYLGLARYDALLSPKVIEQISCPILTVQNSFLPSIKSEKAYSLAYEQGLKMVGATAKLVQAPIRRISTAPIVEQASVKLAPGLSEKEICLIGQDMERKVFASALRKLVEHKVMVYNAKTIVFD